MSVCNLSAMVEAKVPAGNNTGKYEALEAFKDVSNAIKKGYLKPVQEYFNAIPKPDVNFQDADGWTLLMVAASAGKGEIVDELLLIQKAAVDKQNSWGGTALMLAVKRADSPIVLKLLDQNAKKDIRDRQGRTAQDIAADITNKDDQALIITLLAGIILF